MEAEGSGGKAGQCQWTTTESSFMLTFLSNIVANGTRTSSGFKKVHLNACAKALNEHFKLDRTGDQIANHLKTWRRKYTKINQLRKVSGANFDEDNYVISLDHEHYANHIKVKLQQLFLFNSKLIYTCLVTALSASICVCVCSVIVIALFSRLTNLMMNI